MTPMHPSPARSGAPAARRLPPPASLALLVALAAAAQAQDQPAQRDDRRPPAGAPEAPARGLRAKTEASAPGYTLYAPLRSHSTYLVDLDGAVLHEWKAAQVPGQSVHLLDDGSLLRCERVESPIFHGGGQGGAVRRYAPDGSLLWEYVCADETRLQHHDVEPLPNGNVLLVAWERKLGDECFALGRDEESLQSGELWPDMVLEIKPTGAKGGEIAWEWHAWDHLVQDRDPARPNHGKIAEHPRRIDINAGLARSSPAEDARLRALGYAGDAPRGRPPEGGDWTHVNAIDHHAELDLVVLSVHTLNELWIIDHSTTTAEARTGEGGKRGVGGDLVARVGGTVHSRPGEPVLFGQHTAHWIEAGKPGAGNLLLFNNGLGSTRGYSSVDEIVFDLSPEALAKGSRPSMAWTWSSPDIKSDRISGAQRLSNGNTLVCAGEGGRIVEVDPQGKVAWDYLQPHGGEIAPPGRGPGGRGGEGRGPARRAGEERGPGGPPPAGDAPGFAQGPPRQGEGEAGRADAPRRGAGRGPDGRAGRGPGGGPMSPNSVFRAERYAPDHPGIVALFKAKASAGK